MKRKWYYGDETDEKALRYIMSKYGLSSESDAIRLLLRLAANEYIKVTMPSSESKIVQRLKKGL